MVIAAIITKVESAFKTAVLVLDLTGTFVFAVSGAISAIRHRLDIFGVLVVCSRQRPSAAWGATC